MCIVSVSQDTKRLTTIAPSVAGQRHIGVEVSGDCWYSISHDLPEIALTYKSWRSVPCKVHLNKFQIGKQEKWWKRRAGGNTACGHPSDTRWTQVRPAIHGSVHSLPTWNRKGANVSKFTYIVCSLFPWATEATILQLFCLIQIGMS